MLFKPNKIFFLIILIFVFFSISCIPVQATGNLIKVQKRPLSWFLKRAEETLKVYLLNQDLNKANAISKQVKARRWPRIGLTLGHGWEDWNSNYNFLTPTISGPFLEIIRNRYRIKAADENVKIEKSKIHYFMNQQKLKIAQLYFNILQQQIKKEILTISLITNKKIYQLYSQLDEPIYRSKIFELETKILNLSQSLLSIQTKLQSNIFKLQDLLDLNEPILPEGGKGEFYYEIPNDFIKKSIEQSFMLKIYKVKKEICKQNFLLSKAERFPKPFIEMGTAQFRSEPSVWIGVTMPIFTGGEISSRIQEQRIKCQKVQTEYVLAQRYIIKKGKEILKQVNFAHQALSLSKQDYYHQVKLLKEMKKLFKLKAVGKDKILKQESLVKISELKSKEKEYQLEAILFKAYQFYNGFDDGFINKN